MSDPQLGQLLALLSAIAFAVGSVFVAKGAKGGGDRGVLFSILVTMIFSCILWLLLEPGNIGQYGSERWWQGVAWFALAGILAMVFGRTLVYASIRYLGVTRSSSVKRLNPFFSVILAYIFLAEAITKWDIIGMCLIAVAFGLLVSSNTNHDLVSESQNDKLSPAHYLWGVGSALAYAFAYIARKHGIEATDTPVFGTMISAATGFVFFTIAAIFSKTWFDNLRRIFSNLNLWLFLAAIFVSMGQILQFSALYYETVSTVVMINSMEIFIASFLSVVIFRAERRPDIGTYIGAIIATAGVIIVAAG